MSEQISLNDIVEVQTIATDEGANRRPEEGWILLDARFIEIRRAPNFTDHGVR